MPAQISPPPKKANDRFDEWLYRFWTLTTAGISGSLADPNSTISTASIIAAGKVRVIGGPYTIEDGASLTIEDGGRLVLI